MKYIIRSAGVSVLALLVLGLSWLASGTSGAQPQIATAPSVATHNGLHGGLTPTPTGTPMVCGPDWRMVFSPNPGSLDNKLYAIEVISANDVWAVGSYRNTGGQVQTLTIHWNGTEWSIVPSPGLGTLRGIAARTASDIWAVGYSGTTSLIMRWNGSQWSIVPGPNPGTAINYLYDVEVIAADDAWATGAYSDFNDEFPSAMTFRWNGSQWTEVAVPSLPRSQLFGLAAVSAADIWAVGEYRPQIPGTPYRTLILRWNGTEWSVAPSPDLDESRLFDVTAISHNDVWAVGTTDFGDITLIENWNGADWSVMPSPNVGGALLNRLNSVSAVSADDVWAVGAYSTSDGTGSIIEHWNGTEWSLVAHPSPPTYSRLYGVAAASALDVWAVGDYGDILFNARTWIARYGDPCLTPTPTRTGTPATATRTPTPLTPSLTPTVTPTITVTPVPCLVGWNAIASVDPSAQVNAFNDVDARSSGDVWAVGVYGNGQMLLEHWDGTHWAVVPGMTSTYGDPLHGIAAIAADDAWAVGWSYSGPFGPFTRIMRWNGTQWSAVTSPNPGGQDWGHYLLDVDAVGANDVWAVGYREISEGAYGTFILHWDGNSWSVVPSPNVPGQDNLLQGVKVISTNDVWAVGYSGPSSARRTLTLHWNGTQWSLVPSPSAPGPTTVLYSVDATGSNDVWAVGAHGSFVDGDSPAILRWNGSWWESTFGSDNAILQSVSAIAPDDVWAVGYDDPFVPQNTVIQHWDGTAWSVVPGPNPGAERNLLYGVSAVSSDLVWAVGQRADSQGAGPYLTLTARYMRSCGTTTPVATSTSTPSRTHTSTATFTRTPSLTPIFTGTAIATSTPTGTTQVTATATIQATATATATATVAVTATSTTTPCTMTFIDVQTTDYFYEPVRYMYCNGIISGYEDNTFRPYNNTTRSQMVKIVVLGFGIPLSQVTTPTFADVPTSNAFFVFVETAAENEIVSGYQCGGPAEPCDGLNRPYFRPYNLVTRGQLSKIVVVATGWEVLEPTEATFQDVAPGTAFYGFVETAYAHEIISGYNCGSSGEPCPGLYFRPGNNATRGQIAKIAYLALLDAP